MQRAIPRIVLICGAIALCCPACDDGSDGFYVPGGQKVEGFFHAGFEYSSFYPCGSSEVWMAGGADLGSRYSGLHLKSDEKAYTHIYGVLHGPGSYGHMGGYTWRFEVLHVYEIRGIIEGDCGISY